MCDFNEDENEVFSLVKNEKNINTNNWSINQKWTNNIISNKRALSLNITNNLIG